MNFFFFFALCISTVILLQTMYKHINIYEVIHTCISCRHIKIYLQEDIQPIISAKVIEKSKKKKNVNQILLI